MKNKKITFLFIFLLTTGISKSQISITSIQQQDIPTALNQINWKDLKPNYQTNLILKGSGFSALQSMNVSAVVLDSIKNVPSIKAIGLKEKEMNSFTVQNDDYIKIQIFKIIDDNNLELAITFTQFATTGKKVLLFNDKKLFTFYVISPNKLPEFQPVTKKTQIALGDPLTAYFLINNINNYNDISIGKPGGSDLSGIQILASQFYPDQSQIAITLKISDQRYFDEGYRLYLSPKDSISPGTPKYLLISQLFDKIDIPHLDFTSVKLYTDYIQDVLLLPSPQINLLKGDYRLKNFNGADYDLVFGLENGQKFLKTKTPLLFPTDKGYNKSCEILKVESGNTEVPIGYFVDIGIYKKEVFSNFELFQDNKSKITTLLISHDTSKNNFFIKFSAQNYPIVAKPLEERIYLKNNLNHIIPLEKIKSTVIDDQKISYLFKFSVPTVFDEGIYKLFYLDINDREIEISSYNLKALNSPLINNSEILTLSFLSKGSIVNSNLTPGDTVLMVKDIDYKNPQLTLNVDLTDNDVKKSGDQYIKFDFETFDENNTLIDKKSQEALFQSGKKTSIPLNTIIFTTYKPWYSIKISASIIINSNNYTEIPKLLVGKQNLPIIQDEKIILVGKYLEKSIGLSFPLQQSIIYYNKKADISNSEKKWVASPFTLSVDFNLNWRDLKKPKTEYRWYMGGISLLGNTTKLAEADNYYVGLLPFFGWRFQKGRKIIPNVVIGAGAAYHLVPSTNFSQIVPQVAFRFGFDISNQ